MGYLVDTINEPDGKWLRVRHDEGVTSNNLDVIDTFPEPEMANIIIDCPLGQDLFDTFIKKYGQQLRKLKVFSNRVTALTCLEELGNIEYIELTVNAIHLWDMAKNPRLHTLVLRRCMELGNVNEIAKCQTLTSVTLDGHSFSGKMWKLDSLHPVLQCKNLEHIDIYWVRFKSYSVTEFVSLEHLKRLNIEGGLFKVDEWAWLAARLGGRVKSNEFNGIVRGHTSEYTFVVGKYKPMLRTVEDAEKIKLHQEKWNRLIEKYRNDPSLQPRV